MELVALASPETSASPVEEQSVRVPVGFPVMITFQTVPDRVCPSALVEGTALEEDSERRLVVEGIWRRRWHGRSRW